METLQTQSNSLDSKNMPQSGFAQRATIDCDRDEIYVLSVKQIHRLKRLLTKFKGGRISESQQGKGTQGLESKLVLDVFIKNKFVDLHLSKRPQQ